MVQPIPEGYHSVTPYLYVQGANAAIEFYKAAFGAEEVMRMDGPGGSVMHAEVKIGDSHVMLTDENAEMGCIGPATRGGTTVSLLIYLENVDEAFARAIAAGATEQRPVEDQFYGDRMGTLVDPFGHVWTLGTHVEDVPPEEMQQRMDAMLGGE